MVFIDPPYKLKNLSNIFDKIIHLKLLENMGIVVIHRHKNSVDKIPSKFEIVKIKIYGLSKIIFLRLT